MKMCRFCSAIFLILITIAPTTQAVTIAFSGQLGFIEEDTGGIYSGTLLGTNFSGEIDDQTFGGFITDGSTSTAFGCCLAAGGLDITNDEQLDADTADLLNNLLGISQYTAGDLVDIVDIEGDVMTSSGGRIEIGISYLLAPTAFQNEDLSNYPFDPVDLEAALFFILEENPLGTDIYSAGGLITAIPLPAAVWLFVSGLIAVVGLQSRKE